jgi:hypothetical protein
MPYEPRKLHKVTSWRDTAFYLYRKLYGRRCVKCSQIVEKRDAVMYRLDGLDELILAHRKCKP